MERKIKNKAVLYGAAAILLVALLSALSFDLTYQPTSSAALPTSIQTSGFLPTFSSVQELKSFLTANSKTQGPFSLYSPYDLSVQAKLLRLPNAVTSGVSANEYSTTNVQVTGVDEADTVKTDGNYIYVVSGNVVSILKAYPTTEARTVSRITLEDLYPVGIYVAGDRLAVLGSRYLIPSSYLEPSGIETETFLNIYDIQNVEAPALLRNLTVTGSYFNSRMIGKYVYFVAGQPAYVTNDTVILPEFYPDGQVKEVEASEIHYSNSTDEYFQYTTFVAVNMEDSAKAPTYLTIMMGAAGGMYVSLDNMYVTFPSTNGNTSVYRIRIVDNDMTCEAKGEVPGSVLNQFSMDEYEGYFRVATTAWATGIEKNGLYVLNMSLETVGKLEDLAVGEHFHSARFMGDRCYLVTFQKVDPLFVIDLSDPADPTVLGNLTIPGYSDYLHPYDDAHIIGVGKETVQAEQAYFSWYQGIKISLFDVSNVSDPKQMYNVTIGDRGSDSPVLTDPKAFLFDRTKDLLVLPVLVAKIDPSQYSGQVPSWAYGTPVWQGAYVYNVTLTGALVLKGNVTHMEGTYAWNSGLDVKRSLYIENVLYTVSDKKVKMNSLDDLALLKEIDLP
jgi:inhibitor of cysteine peptidase